MYENITDHGILIVLSSPSGAGKTSLATRIVSENRNIVFSVSATTRLPRSGEVDGGCVWIGGACADGRGDERGDA